MFLAKGSCAENSDGLDALSEVLWGVRSRSVPDQWFGRCVGVRHCMRRLGRPRHEGGPLTRRYDTGMNSLAW